MKKNYFTLFLIAFSLLAFSSCKKDKKKDLEPFNYEFPSSESVFPLGTVLPKIHINLDEPGSEIEKETYSNADIFIDGLNHYENFEGRTRIKGRGNSTWLLPKKPYRLKLDEKAGLFGLTAYKDWILLSEYLDGSMLYNSIPFTMGKLLGIPYTHNPIPVEVYLNDELQGIYAFMEHKEVGQGRIDIGNDGTLLELDTYYDEEFKFESKYYNLPVMVQFPKEKDMSQIKLNSIQSDFEFLEALIYDSKFPDNDYHNFLDIPSFINYIMLYEFTYNKEILHPKSTYMNKKKGGKFNMGILWDFDWSFGYSENQDEHFGISAVNAPLFEANENLKGSVFFQRILEDSRVRKMYAERWNWFKTNHLQTLKNYVSNYGEIIRQGFENDHELWGKRTSSGDIDTDIQKTLNWLDARANYMDNYVKKLTQGD